MWKKIKQWFRNHIDYRIVGEYLDNDGNGRYTRKFIRKYYFKFK